MGTTCLCWLCGREASEYQIGATGIYHLTCRGYCGEYEYDPTLFEAQQPHAHWEESRRSLAEALHGGLRHTRFTSVRELMEAFAEMADLGLGRP
jgi:hypothetical protein